MLSKARLVEIVKAVSALEWLLLVFAVGITVQAGFWLNNSLFGSWMLNDLTGTLAQDIREAQSLARQLHDSVAIDVVPMTMEQKGAYKIHSATETLVHRELPDGVTISGHALLDSDGIPARRSTFVIRKARESRQLVIDSSGDVSTQ